MHRVVIFNIGRSRVHLLKLIGAFVMLAGAIMILSGVYKSMLIASAVDSMNAGGGTKQVTLNVDGIMLADNIKTNDLNTQMGLFLSPIASIMVWCAVLIVGMIVYRSGGFFPIEEISGEKKKRR